MPGFRPGGALGTDAVGACELCYVGATDEEIAGCAVEIDSEIEETEDISVAMALTA